MSDVQPIPEGAPSVIPHLVVRSAAEAIEFYKKAFGAKELRRMPTPDGAMIMHAELQIGDAQLYLCDEMPGMESCRSPETLGGTTATVTLWSQDANALWKQATDAGAEVDFPIMDAFWGDRYGTVTDPFGHRWAIVQHIADLSPEEIMQGAAAQFGGG